MKIKDIYNKKETIDISESTSFNILEDAKRYGLKKSQVLRFFIENGKLTPKIADKIKQQTEILKSK